MSKIRIRHGENEIELDGSDEFIKKHLEAFYNRFQAPTATLKEKIFETSSRKVKLSPAEFYKAKGKTDGVSQILIFGKYLEENRNISEFTPKEINGVVKEAKLAKNIHTQYFTNAVKQGLLRSLGNGKYTLTLSAEEALDSMGK